MLQPRPTAFPTLSRLQERLASHAMVEVRAKPLVLVSMLVLAASHTPVATAFSFTGSHGAPYSSGGIGGTGAGRFQSFGLLPSRSPEPSQVTGPAVYTFNPQDLRSLQYSRNNEERLRAAEHQTEFQFRLSPGKFDFSLEGAFGLGAVFSNPEFEMRSSTAYRRDIDQNLPELHNGLSYSAGVNIEHEQAHISDSAYVSSGQLGLSYGRLGSVWYSGVDFSLQQLASDASSENSNEVLSFDLTTGRKVSWTGVGSYDPLWLLSLRGDFDIQTGEEGQSLTSRDGDWTINPSLFWKTPGFKFSAQLEVPIDEDLLKDFEEPDYKLRAVIEKSFK